MKPREFLGHCYCDSRFIYIEETILHGPIELVLQIQQVNESMPKMHRYQQVVNLLKERLK